jgi:hypothetical protein
VLIDLIVQDCGSLRQAELQLVASCRQLQLQLQRRQQLLGLELRRQAKLKLVLLQEQVERLDAAVCRPLAVGLHAMLSVQASDHELAACFANVQRDVAAELAKLEADGEGVDEVPSASADMPSAIRISNAQREIEMLAFFEATSSPAATEATAAVAEEEIAEPSASKTVTLEGPQDTRPPTPPQYPVEDAAIVAHSSNQSEAESPGIPSAPSIVNSDGKPNFTLNLPEYISTNCTTISILQMIPTHPRNPPDTQLASTQKQAPLPSSPPLPPQQQSLLP